MRRRDLGRMLAGGLVLAVALPANLPTIEELLAPERPYWFGWRPTFRAGVLVLSEHHYKDSSTSYSVSVDCALNADDGYVLARRKVPLYSIPLGRSGPINIEVWKHDGWYYGVLNDQVRGMERIPSKQEMLGRGY